MAAVGHAPDAVGQAVFEVLDRAVQILVAREPRQVLQQIDHHLAVGIFDKHIGVDRAARLAAVFGRLEHGHSGHSPLVEQGGQAVALGFGQIGHVHHRGAYAPARVDAELVDGLDGRLGQAREARVELSAQVERGLQRLVEAVHQLPRDGRQGVALFLRQVDAEEEARAGRVDGHQCRHGQRRAHYVVVQ